VDGIDTGLQIDRLTLRSAPGGAPDTATTPLVDDAEPVLTNVLERDRWRFTADVGPRAEPTWLVIGQSHNDGWRATLDGKDLGPPQLVDGYSSGFLLPPGTDPATVEVVWTPQKTVFWGLWLSLIAAAGCLLLVLRLWRRRRRARGVGAVTVPADASPPDVRPLPLDLSLVWRSGGSPPSWPVTVLSVVAVGLVAGAAISVGAAVGLAAVALLGLRVDRSRPILALGPAALMVVAALYVAGRQVLHRFSAGFRWPQHAEAVHGLVYAGVLLLVVEAVVRHLRRPPA
jgi:arabinofuranan 3-O-arabinosyltransferase